MALTFFWRCEGTTLDATADENVNNTTETAGTNGAPAINATAALAGSNGIEINAGGEHYRFASDDAVNVNRLTGSIGFLLHIPTAVVSNASLMQIRGSGFGYNYTISQRDVAGNKNLRLVVNDGGTSTNLDMTGNLLSTAATYFVTASWDHGNNLLRIRFYNNSTGALIDSASSSSAFTAPVDLDFATGIRIGEVNGIAATYYLDNIFIGDAYADADTFLTNRNITTHADYNAGGSSSATPSVVAQALAGVAPLMDLGITARSMVRE